MVNNYSQWVEAVNTEFNRLWEVAEYLNEDGKERKEVMCLLYGLSLFCGTALELVKMMETYGFSVEELKLLESPHARGPLDSLRRLVDQGRG